MIFFLLCTAAATKKKPPAKPVNINTATSEELQQVPGIGPATAGKILQMRKSYGAFKSVDDLLAIRGLGQKRLDKMRKYLTVGKIPESKSKVAPKSDAGTKSPVQQPPLAKAAIAGHISAHLRLRSFSDAHRVASG